MIVDVQPEDIIGDYKEVTLELYGFGDRKILYTEIETIFPEGKLIVSTTTPGGYITNINQAFIDISGYREEELVGSPHSILRHPDMPPAAFQGLWDTISKGDKWQGFVKNLRKDGGYYWVNATVIPNIRKGKLAGYTSVRRKASRTNIDACVKLY
ncbi:MAG: PAS domain-containing protein, partial [Xanthomonadales bacterium]|nr:PAS domain-containing protein [Xanthomonadales bacterium]